MSARTWNWWAWTSLAAWAICVFFEHRAKGVADELALDADAHRNGNGKPAERELELDLEELNRP